MIILRILSICCLLYFILMLILTGGGSFFHYIWLAAALIMRLIIMGHDAGLAHRIPGPVTAAAAVIAAVFCLAMAAALAGILRGAWSKPSDQAAYVIVLGARLRGSVPSKALVFRMKKALSYSKDHPGCRVIVSGGQGISEKIPEAAAMKAYMTEQGLDPSMIFEEVQSFSTRENLMYSARIIARLEGGDEKQVISGIPVVICTSNFHIYRSLRLAKKMGYGNVTGLPSYTDPVMMPSYGLRECLAINKEKIQGNL